MHHLEATFRDAVTISYDQGEIIHTIKRCQNGVKRRDVMIANAVDDTVQFFRLFKDQIAVQKEAISDDRMIPVCAARSRHVGRGEGMRQGAAGTPEARVSAF